VSVSSAAFGGTAGSKALDGDVGFRCGGSV